MNLLAEHTDSYYAATANGLAEYPRLQGEHTADVAVVGAGFTGVSSALHLAERGYKVALIEANRVGWGASGRNGGQMIDGMAGQVMAEVISGDSERFDVFAAIKHWRLPGGKWFANPALALGMLYFRLNEIL